MPVGLAAPITTSGRSITCEHAASITAKAAEPHATAIARGHVLELLLCCERILDSLPLQLKQGLNPAPVVVVKYTAGIVGRNHVISAGAHGSLWRVDLFVAEALCDQPDLSAMLDIDQSVLTHDPAIPQRIRG